MGTKDDRARILLNQLNSWIAEGLSGEDAIAKLSINQYDFLIDYGVNLDDMLLSKEQQQNIHEVKKVRRSPSPQGYNKKYPEQKQQLYNHIVEAVKSFGGEIIPREKQNFRDLDFNVNGTKYKIVLSNPRN